MLRSLSSCSGGPALWPIGACAGGFSSSRNNWRSSGVYGISVSTGVDQAEGDSESVTAARLVGPAATLSRAALAFKTLGSWLN
jgi:hypothetical protein